MRVRRKWAEHGMKKTKTETENNTLTETKTSAPAAAFNCSVPVEDADYSLKVSEYAVFKASAIKEDASAYDEFINMAQKAAAEENEDINSEDCKTLR